MFRCLKWRYVENRIFSGYFWGVGFPLQKPYPYSLYSWVPPILGSWNVWWCYLRILGPSNGSGPEPVFCRGGVRILRAHVFFYRTIGLSRNQYYDLWCIVWSCSWIMRWLLAVFFKINRLFEISACDCGGGDAQGMDNQKAAPMGCSQLPRTPMASLNAEYCWKKTECDLLLEVARKVASSRKALLDYHQASAGRSRGLQVHTPFGIPTPGQLFVIVFYLLRAGAHDVHANIGQVSDDKEVILRMMRDLKFEACESDGKVQWYHSSELWYWESEVVSWAAPRCWRRTICYNMFHLEVKKQGKGSAVFFVSFECCATTWAVLWKQEIWLGQPPDRGVCKPRMFALHCAASHIALWLWFGLLFGYVGTFSIWRALFDLDSLLFYFWLSLCPAMPCHLVVGAELSSSGEVLLRAHVKLLCASSLDVFS